MNTTTEHGDAPDSQSMLRTALHQAAAALYAVANDLRRNAPDDNPTNIAMAYFAEDAAAKARAAARVNHMRVVS
jgi:hypothetical protein